MEMIITADRARSSYCQGTWFLILLIVSCLLLCGSGAFCAEANPYRVEFKGIRDKELLEQMQGLSKTLESSSGGAVPLSILRKRAMDDMDLFVRLLKSEGYFDAQISEKIETGESRWKLVFDFTLTKPFVLSSVEITFSPGEYDGLTAAIASEARAGLQNPYKGKADLEREEKLLFPIKKR